LTSGLVSRTALPAPSTSAAGTVPVTNLVPPTDIPPVSTAANGRLRSAGPACPAIPPDEPLPEGTDPTAFFVPEQQRAGALIERSSLVMEVPEGGPFLTVDPIDHSDLVVVTVHGADSRIRVAMVGSLDRASGTFARRLAIGGCFIEHAQVTSGDRLLFETGGLGQASVTQVAVANLSDGSYEWRWELRDRSRWLRRLPNGAVFLVTEGERWGVTTLDAANGTVLTDGELDLEGEPFVIPSDASDLYVATKDPGAQAVAIRRITTTATVDPTFTIPGFNGLPDTTDPAAPVIAREQIWWLNPSGTLEARSLSSQALTASIPLGLDLTYGFRMNVGSGGIWVASSDATNASPALLKHIDPVSATVRATHTYAPTGLNPRVGGKAWVELVVSDAGAWYEQCKAPRDPFPTTSCRPLLVFEAPNEQGR
jgi:hypothetical protein